MQAWVNTAHVFLLVLILFIVGSTEAGKSLRLRHRRKRQLGHQECFTQNTAHYPCTKTVMQTFPLYCVGTFYPYICQQRPVVITTTCTRTYKVCCDGYSALGAACIHDSKNPCNGSPMIINNTLSGFLTSYNHPQNYMNLMNCQWNIEGPNNAYIIIRVTKLDLQSQRLVCTQGTCTQVCDDKLEINDESNSIKLCGSRSTIASFTSSENKVNVTFTTDSHSTYPGFRMEYVIIVPETTTTTVTSQATTTPQATTTSPTTTTSVALIPSTAVGSNRSLTNNLCLGDQEFVPCQPPCNYRCELGRIVSYNCFARTCTPTCACPLERYISHGSRCLSEQQCHDQLPPKCEGVKQHTTCMRCPLSCPGYERFAAPCTDAPGNCRNGCSCPSFAPYVYAQRCIPHILCPLPPVFPQCEGGRVYTGCITCPRTCPGWGNPITATCVPDPNNCVSGCACPSYIPFWHNRTCVAVCPPPPVRKIKCGTQYYLPKTRIVGGEWAVAGSWPWITQVIKGILGAEKHQCGGTLICSNWILTAAHCFQHESGFVLEKQAYLYSVNVGKHKKGNETARLVVNQVADKVVIHPHYNLNNHVNDIALIRIPKKIEMTRHIRPACVPEFIDPYQRGSAWGPPIGAFCYVAGWGSTKKRGPAATVLKQASLRVRSSHECKLLYQDFDERTMICVGGDGNHDTCQGDSGGPLICKHGQRWYVDGVTSYGLKCGARGFPAVYTRVTSYTKWLRQQMAGSSDCAGGANFEWVEKQ